MSAWSRPPASPSWDDVWCVDIDAEKVDALQRGEVPIYVPGLEELLRSQLGASRFSTDLSGALDTRGFCSWRSARPPRTRAMRTCRRSTPSWTRSPLSEERALVMKSTVPCGTGVSLKRMFAEQGKGGLGYVSCRSS